MHFNEDVTHFFIDDCVPMMILLKFIIVLCAYADTIEIVKMWRGGDEYNGKRLRSFFCRLNWIHPSPPLYQSQNVRHSYIYLSLSSFRVAGRFLLYKLTGEGWEMVVRYSFTVQYSVVTVIDNDLKFMIKEMIT
jgi:hypothetical protein